MAKDEVVKKVLIAVIEKEGLESGEAKKIARGIMPRHETGLAERILERGIQQAILEKKINEENILNNMYAIEIEELRKNDTKNDQEAVPELVGDARASTTSEGDA